MFPCVLCVHLPLSTWSSTGSKDACYSDLWLRSASGQQVCVCAYVWVWAKPVWPRIRGGKRCHGPRDWSLLREPINKEKISLRKGNTAVSKEELNLLVALHSTATRQKVISLFGKSILSPSHCVFNIVSSTSHIFTSLSTSAIPFHPPHSCHEDNPALVWFPLQSLWWPQCFSPA